MTIEELPNCPQWRRDAETSNADVSIDPECHPDNKEVARLSGALERYSSEVSP